MDRTDDKPAPSLHESIEELFKGVQTCATEEDDVFFERIGNQLNQVCSAVASQLNADSCAILFVDKDGAPEKLQTLIMRGASGQLFNTLESTAKRGKEFSAYIASPGKSASLTQTAWHCGLARWANTREEMEALRKPTYTGTGDDRAYQGHSLKCTFRNCVMVPIFAPGRVSRPPSEQEISDLLGDIGNSSFERKELCRHVRFLWSHRVVGMLKAENKLPRLGPNINLLAPEFRKLFRGPQHCECSEKCGLVKENKCSIREKIEANLSDDRSNRNWRDRYGDVLANLWEQQKQEQPAESLVELSDDSTWNHVCRPAVDFLTKAWDATFSNQDVELLVSVAMLLGRVLPWRTIQRASAQRMVLDENEVGSLLINADDITGLNSLHRAAERICSHVTFLLQQLQSDLRHQESSRIAMAHRQGVLPVRSPISSIKARTKTYASLLHKAIGKHNEQWDRAVAKYRSDRTSNGTEVPPPDNLFTTHKVVRRLISHEFYDIRDICGVRLTCDYLSDVAQVVHAIIRASPGWGVRIRKVDNKLKTPETSGYRSVHLDLLVKANDIVGADDIALLTSILSETTDSEGSVPRRKGPDDLVRDQGKELWLPCEIQIRTAYESSWADKSHELVYKLDRSRTPLQKELEDFFTIMSNNLFETDRLSDIVQEQIREFLAPELSGEQRLRTILRERLRLSPCDAALQKRSLEVAEWPLGYLTFAMECAQELYKRNVEYGGGSQYDHVVSVVLQLVQRFGLLTAPRNAEDWVTDGPPPGLTSSGASLEQLSPAEISRQVTLFALALLHDCWMAATDQRTGLIQDRQREIYWDKEDVIGSVNALIETECRQVIEHYGDLMKVERLWGPRPAEWVKEMLGFFRDYWRVELGDVQRGTLPGSGSGSDQDEVGALTFVRTSQWAGMIEHAQPSERRDVCQLMAALLVERLEELPETPNIERRRGRFNEAYLIYRTLRDNLQGTVGGTAILDQCYVTLRKVAAQLNLEIPIHWYE